jgi:hypothetical protein
MSLDREYGASKIGATRKKAFTAGATVNVELVPAATTGVFQRASFAIRSTKAVYLRQNGTTTAPSDMTLEFELLTSFIWRIDVDADTERYLHLRGVSDSGTMKITDITKTTGTTSDLG